ncbi:hypothetical protein Hanom_Chr17g01527661 [Helianthus anomalus]
MKILCVIVISVERNLLCVLFTCIDIMSNFVLMMINLCVFCFFIFHVCYVCCLDVYHPCYYFKAFI